MPAQENVDNTNSEYAIANADATPCPAFASRHRQDTSSPNYRFS